MDINTIINRLNQESNLGDFVCKLCDKNTANNIKSRLQSVLSQIKYEKMFFDFNIYEENLNIYFILFDFDKSIKNFVLKYSYGVYNLEEYTEDLYTTSAKVIIRFLSLEKGWDGDNADPISKKVIYNSVDLANHLPEDSLCTIISSKQMNFEFKYNSVNFEIDVFEERVEIKVCGVNTDKKIKLTNTYSSDIYREHLVLNPIFPVLDTLSECFKNENK